MEIPTPMAFVLIVTMMRKIVPTRRFTFRGLRRRQNPKPSKTNRRKPSDDSATRTVIGCDTSVIW
jgi:hypothetical protein